MRLEGSLDAFSLPDIFSLLSMTKKTGGLHLRRDAAHGVVWLGDGVITGGAPELTRLSLGRRLAGSGRVADNHLSAAVEQVAQTGDAGIARVLRDNNSIDEGELHSLVCEHIVDTVFDLMRWPDGSFEFVIDEANIDDVGVTQDVDEVVAEARRRLEQWRSIEPQLADPTTVLSIALELPAANELQPQEWELLALVDGQRSVGDIVDLLGRGEYAVVVALAALAGRGLIRSDDAAGIAAMTQRQQLIASLEAGSAPNAAPASDPAPAPASPPPIETIESPVTETFDVDVDLTAAVDPVPAAEPAAESTTDDENTPADSYDDVASPTEQIAEVTELPRLGSPRDLSAVTPQRPEPFMPGREPDHPEPLAAAMAGGGSVTPMPLGAIERDPSVNKSLLLRLIAGVRGL